MCMQGTNHRNGGQGAIAGHTFSTSENRRAVQRVAEGTPRSDTLAALSNDSSGRDTVAAATREVRVSDSSPKPGENRPATASAAELAAALAQARDRLAFYESFDSLIQDNIRRSSELLHLVADERERNERRLVAMRQEVEQKLTAQQEILRSLATSLDGLQSSLATIARQVGGALDQLEASSPDTVDVPGNGPAGRLAGEQDLAALAPKLSPDEPELLVSPLSEGAGKPEAKPVDSPGDDVLTLLPASVGGGEAAGAPPALPAGAPEQLMATRAESGAGGEAATSFIQMSAASAGNPPEVSGEAETASAERGGEDEQPGPQRLDLVIRGVPRAAAALSIQRYLQDQATIDAVEVREYVAGVLRFQLEAARFDLDMLTGWAQESPATVVASSDRAVELQYPG